MGVTYIYNVRACAQEVGGLDRQCVYLAREGERERGERERESSAWVAMAGV